MTEMPDAAKNASIEIRPAGPRYSDKWVGLDWLGGPLVFVTQGGTGDAEYGDIAFTIGPEQMAHLLAFCQRYAAANPPVASE